MSRSRLSRLLFLVPYVVQNPGVKLQEAAKALGVGVKQLRADVELLSMVGRPPLTPDHLIDIVIEDECLRVYLDQNLSRPLRLTHDEARALALSVFVGADDGDAMLAQILEKISGHLDETSALWVNGVGERLRAQASSENILAAELERAAMAHQWVHLRYYSVASAAEKEYHLKPLGLVSHSGLRYLVALDTGSEGSARHDPQGQEKLFRLDRIADTQVLDQHFEPIADVDLSRYERDSLISGAGQRATVRFSEDVAPWVLERFERESVKRCEDGGIEVQTQMLSEHWLRRWVLSYGLDAELLAPDDTRLAMADFCLDAAKAYR